VRKVSGFVMPGCLFQHPEYENIAYDMLEGETINIAV